ncbi:MAG TPA: TonB-dependent receptor [Xanthomonadales bacterium]|nr:TonB-dependent receptor [Xanthomonadales bacterium]
MSLIVPARGIFARVSAISSPILSRWGAVVLLAGLWTSWPVLAAETDEDAKPPKDEILELESFQVTATRRPVKLLDVAEAITLVEGARITREAPRVLAELLRGQPGTFFQQTTPGQGIPIIRGLKGSEVLHLVDGMRLNNAFFRNAPNQYVALVDSFAVERMEVIRGAAPSLHGADAMGGVMQVLTEEPKFSTDSWDQSGRLYGSYNSVDKAIVGRASGAVGKQGSVFSGGVTWQDFGDRTTGGGAVVEPTSFKVRAGDVKWRQDLSASSELMLSAQVLNQPATPRIDELVPGYGQDEPSSILYEFKPNRRSFLHARYRLFGESRWFERMEVHAARQVIIDDRLAQDTGSLIQTDESNKSTLDGVTLQFNTPWGSVTSGQRDLVWGAEYYTDTVKSSRLQTDTETGQETAARGRFPDDSTMDSLAVYAANRWQWGKLTFEAGLRYSAFDIHLPASGDVPDTRLTPNDLTGDIHASYELRSGVRLVANAGRGFRPPNIFDLGTLGARPGNRYNEPNPNLKPESVWSYDLGLKTVSARWETESFIFYSDYRDKITSVFTGEVTPEGRLIVRSENLNEATLYGFEFAFSFHATEELDAYATVNYTHGVEKDAFAGTVPADRVPPLNTRIGMIYTPGFKLRIQPWLDLVAKQDRLSPRDEEDPRINPEGTPGYVTFNLLLSWQATPDIELGLRLENLGDKNYREHGSGIDAPGRNTGFWLNALF